ncbi:hypothetical protein QMP26_05595 [Enterocloster clostridioformis]|nr:hypothetical protein [uncultured Anaerostipes sp.]
MMREEKIIVYPFEEVIVLDYQAIQEINEHAQVEIKGRIPFDKKNEYIAMGRKNGWVKVVTFTEGNENIIFYGIMYEMRLEVVSGTCIIYLYLRSGTSLMDYNDQIRSFQDKNLTYSNLLDICNQGYDDSAKIMTAGKGKVIDRFIMQYKETDWRFIKRLASMNHTIVVADCYTKGEKYHFGIPDRKGKTVEELKEYRMICDAREYQNKNSHGLNIRTEDTVSYVWVSRDSYKIGEQWTIDGRRLIIWKIETCRKGDELYHTYYMKPEAGFQSITYNNNHLCGVALFGKVKRIKDEKVQIEILEDQNKDRSGACWFSFASPYSTPDGTGWYCMPEPGDKIRLYFPTEKEEDAYVSSSYHEEGSSLRTRPECKFWRNKEGKEIQLFTDYILITNNDGTFIKLSDTKGIEIVSTGSVRIRAEGLLDISSNSSSIEMNAHKKVMLKQGDTEINLAGDLNMKGARVML